MNAELPPPIHAFVAAKTLGYGCDWRISNLKMQKILYIAHMCYMGQNNGVRLINTPFEAWDYGPVQPGLYDKLKRFGARDVRDVFWGDECAENPAQLDILNSMAKLCVNIRSSVLVGITHRPGSAWNNTYSPNIQGLKIADKNIMKEYGNLLAEHSHLFAGSHE